MNYSHFATFLEQVHDRLVREFDVPPEDAAKVIANLEADAMNAAMRARNERQLVINYRELGPSVLAERMGITPHAVRKRYRKIIDKQYVTQCVTGVSPEVTQ